MMANAGECKGPIQLSYSGKSVRKCAIIAKAQYYCIQSQVKEVEDGIAEMEKDLRRLMKELHNLKKEERYQTLIVCIMSDLLHGRDISIREKDEESSGGVIDLLNDLSSSDDEEVEDFNMSNHVTGVPKVVMPVKKSQKNHGNEAVRKFSRDKENAQEIGVPCVSGAGNEIDCCGRFDNVASLKRNAEDVSQVMSERMNNKFILRRTQM